MSSSHTDPRTMAGLVRLAQKARALRQQADQYDAQRKAAEAAARAIEETDLPEAMQSLGLDSFTLDDGTTIRLKDVVAGSLPASTRAHALGWLEARGYEGLIKTAITVEVPRNLRGLVPELVQALSRDGLAVKTTETVHPSTLGAWAREYLDRMAEGTVTEALPTDLLGLFIGTRAEFKEAK